MRGGMDRRDVSPVDDHTERGKDGADSLDQELWARRSSRGLDPPSESLLESGEGLSRGIRRV